MMSNSTSNKLHFYDSEIIFKSHVVKKAGAADDDCVQ